MTGTPQPRRRIASKQEFDTLMEDGAFVDYFNVFLNQPIFGQRVVYRHKKKEFVLDPTVQKSRHKVFDFEVRDWLRTQRFPNFIQSDLFVEYNLCCRLRDTRDGFLQHKTGDLQSNKEFWQATADFMIGHVTGMQYFRHSILKTPGNIAFACWMDLERFRRLPVNDPERMKMYHHIKEIYLVSGAPLELSVIAKHQAFKGAVNFNLLHDEISMNGPDFMRQLQQSPTNGTEHFSISSPETFVRLQHVMLTALKSYWLPRYILHIHTIAPTLPPQKPRSGRPHSGRPRSGRAHSGKPCSARPCSGKSCCGRACCGKPCYQRPCSGRPASGRPCSSCVQESNKDFFTNKTRMRLQNMFPDSFTESFSVTPEEVYIDIKETPCHVVNRAESAEPSDLLTLWGGNRLFPTYDDLTSSHLSDVSSKSHDSSFWTPTSAAAKDTPIMAPFAGNSKPRRFYDSSETPGTGSSNDTGNDDVVDKRRKEKLAAAMNEENHSLITVDKGELSPTVRHLIRGQFYMTKSGFEQDNKRLVAAIASETLTGHPLEAFLSTSSSFGSLGYLQLLNDLQVYLRTDGHRTDCLGRSIKQILGTNILKRYSLEPSAKNSVFPTKDQQALTASLMYGSPAEAVIRAQELCCMVLKPAWQAYINNDRNFFVNKVTRKGVSKLSASNNLMNGDLREVMQYPDDGRTSMWTALELAAISRFPNGLKPESDIHELMAVKEQGFGSLGRPARRTHYNVVLRDLIVPKKLNITKLRVSRRSLYERPEIPADRVTDNKDVQIKKNGVVINRPLRPRCFIEILTNSVHYEFFKRYLVLKRAATPLLFWKQVQDLKETKNARQRITKVAQIFRRFFSKYAQHGAQLDCSDEIIKQVTQMERVTASMIVCAQGAVMRSLEKKWYEPYLATFPEDDTRSPLPSPLPHESSQMFKEFEMEWSAPPKRSPIKLATFGLWVKCLRVICQFMRSMKDNRRVMIFWIYLKLQVKKALQKKGGAPTEVKIVLQNRLLVVNKLPQDLLYWVEVTKYTEIMNDVIRQGTMFRLSKTDEENLRVKANAIVSCFLNSDIQPKLQVNVTQEAASNVIALLAGRGPTRSIFHETIMSIFPVLFHYFKNCCDEWKLGKMNLDFEALYTEKLGELKSMEQKENTPPNSDSFPSYHNLTVEQFKRVVGPRGDDHFRIIFSIAGGIKMVVPADVGRYNRAALADGKRGSIFSPQSSKRSANIKEKPSKETTGQSGRARLGSVAGPSRAFSTRIRTLQEADGESLNSLNITPAM